MTVIKDQVSHYNQFGHLYRDAIISSPNPETWTSDPNPESAMNVLMRERLIEQEKIVKKYFDTSFPVLDLGCGYGRQTYMMARNNFKVTGVDSSDVFVDIGKELFRKHNFQADFLCDSVLSFTTDKRYRQITLFDVVEHFKPDERKIFMRHLAEKICDKNAVAIITFPFMDENSIKDRAKNIYKSFSSHFPFLSEKKEHPYPIPYKSNFTELFAPYFKLKEYLHKNDTAFFVLERI